MTAEDIIRQALEGKFFHYIGKPPHETMDVDHEQQKIKAAMEAKIKAEQHLKKEIKLRPQREIMLRPRTDGPSPEQIMAAVGLAYEMATEEICSKSRTRLRTIARHHMAWELRYRKNLSTVSVGELIGRDHTTIVNSLQFVRRNKSLFADKMAYVSQLIGGVDG